MRSVLFVVVFATLLTACSSEEWKRTGYEMMKQRERTECLNNPRVDCKDLPSYNEYNELKKESTQK